MFGKKKTETVEVKEPKEPKPKKAVNMKKLEDLYYAAEDARKHAYAPYSDFRVGAALLVKPNEDSVLPKNKMYTGVNIENGSYGATLCAERVAFAKAISDGVLEYDIGENPFIAIAVSAGDEEALPCGICRQFMSEFAPEITVVTKADGQIRIRNLMQLLPESFQTVGLICLCPPEPVTFLFGSLVTVSEGIQPFICPAALFFPEGDTLVSRQDTRKVQHVMPLDQL